MRRYLSLLSLTLLACAVDEAQMAALPLETLPAGPPLIQRTMAVAGEPVVLQMFGVPPGEDVLIGRGSGVAPASSCPPVLRGSCLDLANPTLVGTDVAPSSGLLEVMVGVPARAPVGAPFAFQIAQARGAWVSTAVSGVVSADIAMFGAWNDGFGGYQEVDNQAWRADFGTWHFTRFDNAARHAVAQNDDDNDYFPGLWSRFDWTTSGGSRWYCQTAYAAASEADALATTAADASSPATGGCAGFSWTEMEPAEPGIAGVWSDAFGTAHDISAETWDQGWSRWQVSRFSNLDQVIIAQNDPGNPYFPRRWSRFDWAWVGADLYYCQTAFDAGSEWAARQTPAADAGSVLTDGCGGFAWTRLDP